MDTEKLKYAHLFLGLTRKELLNRIQAGQIDVQLLKTQLDEYSREIRLDSLCEHFFEEEAVVQVDKFEHNK